MIGEGFSQAKTETLLTIRENLLRGLTVLGQHVDAGTAHDIPEKRASSPVEAGSITLGILKRLDEELAWRANLKL